MNIRFVKPQDCKQILDIYNHYINTPVTFEYNLPSEEDFANRINEISNFYPYLVLEENDKIFGYAYAHKLREREAYQWVAELSIYLAPNITSKGYGKILYEKLLEILKIQGIKTVYGCITIPNKKSEKLHEKMGFKKVGTFSKAGYKNGKWLDIAWFEKNIAICKTKPKRVISIAKIKKLIEDKLKSNI